MNEKDRYDLMAKSLEQALKQKEMMDKVNEMIRHSVEKRTKQLEEKEK